MKNHLKAIEVHTQMPGSFGSGQRSSMASRVGVRTTVSSLWVCALHARRLSDVQPRAKSRLERLDLRPAAFAPMFNTGGSHAGLMLSLDFALSVHVLPLGNDFLQVSLSRFCRSGMRTSVDDAMFVEPLCTMVSS